jgi:hypothetical protein
LANGKAANFLEGSAPALPKIFGTSGDVPSSITENFFGASGDAPSNFFQPALEGFVLVDTDLKRGVGRGTRDEGKNGRARLLPSRKRQRVASSK